MEESAMEFPAFPFKPYTIQLQFMKAVYRALQQGGVAIVESPTGTGKTLSLICSTFQWLQDQHARRLAEPAKTDPGSCSTMEDDEPEWMRDFETKKEEQSRREKEERKQQRKKDHKSIASVRKGSGAQFFFGEKIEQVEGHGSRRRSGYAGQPVKSTIGAHEDDEFLVEDYCSDEASSRDVLSKRKADNVSSSDDGLEDEREEEEEEPLKVYFCSRTHSQLSQFVGELQRTTFSSSLRTVSLGSRKTLCINPEVAKLGSSTRINERCLELHKAKSSGQAGTKVVRDALKQRSKAKSSGCPMLRKQRLQRQFTEELVQSGAMDIEDLMNLGRKLGTCPYYGARRAVPAADIVALPYQSLLHSATRDSLGVKLKDCIVIIDEAHNLVDTVTNIHSCKVSASQLQQVSSQLSEYAEKFKTRLAEGNLRYIEILLQLIKAFLCRLLVSQETSASCHQGLSKAADVRVKRADIMTINDFVFSLGIDSINLFKLRRYIKESNIVHKVSSYGEKKQLDQITFQANGVGKGALLHASSPMVGFHSLADLVLALTNADSDGRILAVPASANNSELEEGYLKFVMLNASKHFAEVVKEARAVVLAGGTLQPVSELRDRLFPKLPDEQVHIFSCGHIVPPESILPLAIARGPGGHSFDFTYQSRSSPLMMEELGRLIINISSVVPEGVVVFFPSFEYLSQVLAEWRNRGTLDTIEAKKHVFQEPRSTTAVEATLKEYKGSITQASEQLNRTNKGSQKGALLLCVVGGKMSEGINFSDGMGRCVVMVGLPYPSLSDPELIERMRYIDMLSTEGSSQDSKLLAAQTSTGTRVPGGMSGVHALQRCGQRGREYYDNLCMKAVNQSIGRAIRHIGDYAAILLVDVRYTPAAMPTRYSRNLTGPASKLPEWIRERLINVTGSFGEVHKLLHQFFKHNQQRPQVA